MAILRRAPGTRRRRGAAAIEFALCLPVFVAILFGIIEYGWIFYQQANVVASVRSGVRYGVTIPRNGDLDPLLEAEERVKDTLLGFGYDSSRVSAAQIDAEYDEDTSGPNPMMTVSIELPYEPILGLIPAPEKISAAMTMLMEQ